MRTDFYERREAKIESFKRLASSNQTKASDNFKVSDSITGAIPFGQPILVGHHSERGHRNAIKRSHNAISRGVECLKKSEYYERRAKVAENSNTIFSDDPEAVKKLKAKINSLEKNQHLMKSVNAVVRKKALPEDEKIIKIIALGLTEAQAKEILKPDFCGRIGFASYSLSNNNANIRTAKKRLESLQALEEMETKETEINGTNILESVEKNRVQIFFPGKPAEETRKKLKSSGFRWSPREGAWQAYLKSWNVEKAHSIVNNL